MILYTLCAYFRSNLKLCPTLKTEVGTSKCTDTNRIYQMPSEKLYEALPGVLGIQEEGLFIFRDLGRRVIYFQGFGEKAWF